MELTNHHFWQLLYYSDIVAIFSSGRSSQLKVQTHISFISRTTSIFFLPLNHQGSPYYCNKKSMDAKTVSERLKTNKTFASLVAQMVKHLPAMRETWVRPLGWEDPLEKEMANHSSILAWRIPWTEDPGRLQSMGSQRLGHDWATSHSLPQNTY